MDRPSGETASPGSIWLRRLFEAGYVPDSTRGKVEEFERVRFRGGVDEINALIDQRPVAPISSLREFQHGRFLSAIDAHSPEAVYVETFRVIDELSIKRLEGGKATLLRHLRCLAPPSADTFHTSQRPLRFEAK